MALIPALLQEIWAGPEIPDKYLSSLIKLSAAAKKSGFKCNIWVTHKNNFFNKISEAKCKSLGLYVRDVNEIILRIMTDGFYPKVKPMQIDGTPSKFDATPIEFLGLMNRELVGSYNRAAFADFLRLEILRQEGGYYLDVDTIFNIDENTILKQDDVPLGYKVHYSAEVSSDKNEIKHLAGCNDIIAATPDHMVIQQALKAGIYFHHTYDMTKPSAEYFQHDVFSEQVRNDLENKVLEKRLANNELTLMDSKRYPHSYAIFGKTPKHVLTVRGSGPDTICNGIADHYDTLDDHQKSQFKESLLGDQKELTIANMSVVSRSDRNWLTSSERSRPFEDNSLDTPLLSTNKLPVSYFDKKIIKTISNIYRLLGDLDESKNVRCSLFLNEIINILKHTSQTLDMNKNTLFFNPTNVVSDAKESISKCIETFNSLIDKTHPENKTATILLKKLAETLSINDLMKNKSNPTKNRKLT